MKIAILTLGTRGDVQPYIALGQKLIAENHEACICTGASFEDLIKSYGISFHKASADLMAILETPEGKAMFEGKFSNPVKLMKYAKEVITPAYRKSMDDFLEAAHGADLIIYHPKALGACDIAEFYGIPAICMPPVPITYPISEFPNLALSATGNFGPTFNKLSYSLNQLAESSYIKQINEFRQSKLSMKPRRAGAYKDSVGQHPLRTIYPISPSLFEDVSSWNGHVDVTGFCFVSESGRELDRDVQDFLNQGEPPILITFSSMPLKEPEKFLEDLTKALEATKMRAILLTGSSGLKTKGKDNLLAVEAANLLAIKAAPHRLIMPLCSGIIHHGGAGTTAEALLSGTPQAIIPFNVDQPFWANRLYKLGLSLKPLKVKDLQKETLIQLIEELQNPDQKNRSKAFQAKLEAEEGVVRIFKLLEEILKI